MTKQNQRILLVILDGWGLNPEKKGNAIAMAKTPVFDNLVKKYPNTQLVASGEAIDLPPGHMGNSEVGHQNIGAGRVVPQPSTTITKDILSGIFFDGRKLIPKVMKAAKKRRVNVHLFGLLSDGLVHSHIDHAIGLLKLAHDHKVNCIIHALLDGRDVPPMSAIKYITQLEEVMKKLKTGKIGTLTGRVLYERDFKKWHHTEQLYRLLFENQGKYVQSAVDAVKQAYNQGVTIDEHIPPYVIVDEKNEPISSISNGDVFINWNFRGDRATMITHSITDKDFHEFPRKKHPDIQYICMSLYDENISADIAYPPKKLRAVLSEIISKHGYSQFKTAETTKFYHLTFFFNCRRLRPFPNEVQKMVPSKKVDKYDEVPEMSALEVGDSIIGALNSNDFDFLAVNFANPDMVGHTGNLEAAIKAVEVVDKNLGRVVEVAKKNGYSVIVTADHGNADKMVDYDTGKPFTAHTPSDVPFIIMLNDVLQKRYDKPGSIQLRTDGLLGCIAPTILELTKIPKPVEMTCHSLIKS